MLHLALMLALSLQPQAPAATPQPAQPAAQPTSPTSPTSPTTPAQPRAVPERPVTVSVEGDLFEAGDAVVVATGLKFAEGPLYRPDGTLVICDLQADTVYTMNPADGKAQRSPGKGVETLRNPSGRAAGSALDKDGRLLFTQFDGSLTRLETDGTAKVLADGLDGKKFNMLNDLAVAPDGSVYFSDFGAGKDDHLDHAGLYRWTPDGKVACIVKDVTAPNGVALSADGRTLYAALYRESKVMAYTLGEGGGSVTGSKVFAEVKDAALPGRSSPDGLKLDAHGNVWTTGVGGVWVLDPAGKRIGRIVVPMAANLCFGGPDGKTVFVAAGPRVVSVRLKESATRPGKAAKPAETPADKPADPKPPR